MSDPRWLDTYAAAGHIGLSPDAFRRRVKAGTLPKPSEALGPRNPRWDRAALDAAMTPAAPSRRPLTGALHAIRAEAQKTTPPPELRDRDGWHWVAKSQREISAYWTAHDQWWDTVHSSGSGPAFAGSGYRYLAPVTPPATVAALVEALEAAVDCGLVPKSSAAEGGAMRFSRQVGVADQIRAALALYREAGR